MIIGNVVIAKQFLRIYGDRRQFANPLRRKYRRQGDVKPDLGFAIKGKEEQCVF